MSKSPHKDKAMAGVTMPKKMKAELQKIADAEYGGDLSKLIREIVASKYKLNPNWKEDQ